VTADKGATYWAERKPLEIKLRRQSRLLEIAFDDGQRFELPFEYLRVYSPSAEVKGHGPGQETLQLGKHEVQVKSIELGATHAEKWEHYLERVAKLGLPYPTPARGKPIKLK
jgi:DUF971 family protein